MDAKYTVLLPAFNEAHCIVTVITQLQTLAHCEEILVVDDGSNDGTAELAKLAGARVISHAYNRGYGAALKTGIRNCKSELVILCDADGQHPIQEVQRIAALASQYDMVVGSRINNGSYWYRSPGKVLLRAFASMLAEQKIPDLNSGLRSFRTEVIRRYLHLMPNGFSFSTTSTLALFSKGHPVHYEPIEVAPRQGRPSSLRIWKDGWNTLQLIVRLTVLFNPMKVFLPSAVFFLGASLVYFAAYSATIRVHVTESMVLLFVTGILLLFMGILSEQISALRRDMREDV